MRNNVSCETIPDFTSIRDKKVLKIMCVMYNVRQVSRAMNKFNATMYERPYLTHYETMCAVLDEMAFHGHGNPVEVRKVIDKICELV